MSALELAFKSSSFQGAHWNSITRIQHHDFSAIWWLAVRLYSDIAVLLGISVPSSYCLLLGTVDGIAASKNSDLDNIKFLQTANKYKESAFNFGGIFTVHTIKNCVPMIHEYLSWIQTPSTKEVGSSLLIFLGTLPNHWRHYSFELWCFLPVPLHGVSGPSVTPDWDGTNKVALGKLIELLSPGYVSIGSAAYIPTEHWCILFHRDPKKSQHAIISIFIEMAFCLIQQKWELLQKALHANVKPIKPILMAIPRLDNFCIS